MVGKIQVHCKGEITGNKKGHVVLKTRIMKYGIPQGDGRGNAD